eukprot:sb/3474921/
MAADSTMKVFKWRDEMWGVFTMTILFCAYFICHSVLFLVHFAGMWLLDGSMLLNFCDLTLRDLRYFFAFVFFLVYISGIAEPLSYLTANVDLREKIGTSFSAIDQHTKEIGKNRVTPAPVLVYVEHPKSVEV